MARFTPVFVYAIAVWFSAALPSRQALPGAAATLPSRSGDFVLEKTVQATGKSLGQAISFAPSWPVAARAVDQTELSAEFAIIDKSGTRVEVAQPSIAYDTIPGGMRRVRDPLFGGERIEFIRRPEFDGSGLRIRQGQGRTTIPWSRVVKVTFSKSVGEGADCRIPSQISLTGTGGQSLTVDVQCPVDVFTGNVQGITSLGTFSLAVDDVGSIEVLAAPRVEARSRVIPVLGALIVDTKGTAVRVKGVLSPDSISALPVGRGNLEVSFSTLKRLQLQSGGEPRRWTAILDIDGIGVRSYSNVRAIGGSIQGTTDLGSFDIRLSDIASIEFERGQPSPTGR